MLYFSVSKVSARDLRKQIKNQKQTRAREQHCRAGVILTVWYNITAIHEDRIKILITNRNDQFFLVAIKKIIIIWQPQLKSSAFCFSLTIFEYCITKNWGRATWFYIPNLSFFQFFFVAIKKIIVCQPQQQVLNIMLKFQIPVFSYSENIKSPFFRSSVSSATIFKYYQTETKTGGL